MIRDQAHWLYENYVQRMTTKEWKQVLLNEDDTIIFKGRLWRLKARSLGYGVVEVRKHHLISEEKDSI
jgi:hypothetical protein